jgi:hypothetical protein
MENAKAGETTLFESPGPHNSQDCLEAAFQRLNILGLSDLVLATSTGATAYKALEIFNPQECNIVAVTHVTGFMGDGQQEMTEQVRTELQDRGVSVLTCAHAFGGVGRGVRNKLGSYQVDEIIAYTLRMFGHGVKVGIEISMMAADAGLIPTDREVVAVGGWASGADSAIVVTPSYSHKFLDTVVHEIIAKPRLSG